MKEIIKEYKDKPNRDILEEMTLLGEEFEKTKVLIVNLTHHLDTIEKSYNDLNKEIKNRMGDE